MSFEPKDTDNDSGNNTQTTQPTQQEQATIQPTRETNPDYFEKGLNESQAIKK